MNAREVVLLLFLVGSSFGSPLVADVDIWKDDTTEETVGNFEDTRNFTDAREAKVLNFFPIPVEEECKANDGRRIGICMNTYECRMQGGGSKGVCALGFGVCCVFTATCNQDVFNNITYFVNPNFPDLSEGMTGCTLKVKKIDPEIAQLRLDFIHFNLGQPNRRTGVCEEDSFVLAGGGIKELVLCGINSGQHVYFDVEDIEDAVSISMNLNKRTIGRLWEVRITQVPFPQRAPAGCLQYHTGVKGVIQTMNFADNGRHLANQDYNICMRQESDMCSIVYEPCYENSFKIGSRPQMQNPEILPYDQTPQAGDSQTDATQNQVEADNQAEEAQNEVTEDEADEAQNEVEEGDLQDVGSGDGEVAESRMAEMCSDKILLPCDSEDLLMPGDAGMGFCSLAHCGTSLCPQGESPCRLESSIKPFTVGVHFGATPREESPEDNLGMCLTYEQQPCMV